MKKRRLKIALTLALAAAALLFFSLGGTESLSFEQIKSGRDRLLAVASDHALLARAAYAAVFLTTAFFVPGALALTLLGGLLFGAERGALYAVVSATSGAVLAFLLARYLIGGWIQERFREQLKTFNREIKRHGHNYLFVLRVVPLLPFFVVNYLAGITEISLPRFTAATFLGLIPGALIFSFAGERLGEIDDPSDLFGLRTLAVFGVLALAALLPVILDFLHRSHGR